MNFLLQGRVVQTPVSLTLSDVKFKGNFQAVCELGNISLEILSGSIVVLVAEVLK